MKMWLPVLCTCVLGLAFAAIGGAAALEESEVQFSVDPGQREAGTAQCKAGREVVSGGFFGSIEGEQRAVPQASALTIAPGKPRRWDTVAHNTGAVAASVAGYAYCTKRPILDVARTQNTTAAPGSAPKAEASCRPERGELAYGGGFENGSDGVALPLVSRRSGKLGWLASMLNPGASPVDFSTEVLCDIRTKPVKARKATVQIEDGLSGEALAKCKRGEKLLSGGFENALAAEPGARGFTFASRRSGKRGWKVSSLSEVGAMTLTAYAYCAKR